MTANRLPLLSIVVEWDNVRLADEARAGELIKHVREAVRDLAADIRGAELIVAFDPSEVDAVRLAEVVGGHDPALPARLVEATGATYYELKNAGARSASGELIVFA